MSKEIHTLTKHKTFVEMAPRPDVLGVRNPGGLLCHVAHSLSGLMAVVLLSRLFLASLLACVHIWSDSGSLQGLMHLSAKMDSSVGCSGRLAGHRMGWHLLL